MWDWREAEPQSYIPAVCDAGEARILLPGEIWLPPECSGTQYVVTSCFDVSDGALLDTCAVLGGGGTGGFFSNTIGSAQQVWNTVNLLLRLDRNWQV